MCIPLCSQAMSVKEVKPVKFLLIITFVYCSSFPVLLFSSFLSLGKRNQITEVRSHVH